MNGGQKKIYGVHKSEFIDDSFCMRNPAGTLSIWAYKETPIQKWRPRLRISQVFAAIDHDGRLMTGPEPLPRCPRQRNIAYARVSVGRDQRGKAKIYKIFIIRPWPPQYYGAT